VIARFHKACTVALCAEPSHLCSGLVNLYIVNASP